jgi:hypothetical protein
MCLWSIDNAASAASCDGFVGGSQTKKPDSSWVGEEYGTFEPRSGSNERTVPYGFAGVPTSPLAGKKMKATDDGFGTDLGI